MATTYSTNTDERGKYDKNVPNLLLLHNNVVANQQTRGHSKKLYKKEAGLNVTIFSFTHRVIDTWKSIK